MPTMSKACRTRFCPNKASGPDGWCDVCREKYAPKNDVRESAAKRGYGRPWRKYRAIYLDAHPLCARCKARGLVVPATVVHHIDGNQYNDAWSNLEALCRTCHEAEHGRDRRRTWGHK